MTNLSKELCEICGIEPIYKVMLDNTLMNITDDKEEAEVSAFESGGVIVDTYPDFEQDENFVKLLEIIKRKMCTGYTINEIKQAIRETEWVYG